MKINKKIIFILLGLFLIVWITYASWWKAWGGVKWIGENDQSQRFEAHTWTLLDWVTWYYIDTYTWLKWQAYDSDKSWYNAIDDTGSGDLAWTASSFYIEPTWNGSNYIRTYETTEDWWHSIWSTIEWDDTDYPAFSYCVNLWPGWRLPTKREIFSIMTDSTTNDDWKYTALPSITDTLYWSSTDNAGSNYSAWTGYFTTGATVYFSETSKHRVLCIHD